MSFSKTHTWWSVTAFNDEIAKLQQKEFPPYVKRIYGGLEECPDTKTVHFQGAIQCYYSVRTSQFKDWLPTAHLEPARSKDALIKYAMKTETAIGDKTAVQNTIPHLPAHDICQLIANTIKTNNIVIPDYIRDAKQSNEYVFKEAIILILRVQPKYAGQLMNPSLRNFFLMTKRVWIEKAIVLQPFPDDVLTHIPDVVSVNSEESVDIKFPPLSVLQAQWHERMEHIGECSVCNLIHDLRENCE